MNVLIGSRALAYWQSDFQVKETADWDVISYGAIDGFEWHDPNLLNNYEMALEYATKNTIERNGYTLNIMSMEGLAIIKRSHLWRDHKFQSHITQYHKHGLKTAFDNLDYPQPSSGKLLYKQRLELTHEYFPHKHPKLNISKDEFFKDAVTREYDHDLIHDLVAYRVFPMYKSLQGDTPETVWCDVNKWNDFTHHEKCMCISEETMVTALERFILKDESMPYKFAYIKSLDKVCTTMCSGWFRDFAIDNYPNIVDMFNEQQMRSAVKTLKEM